MAGPRKRPPPSDTIIHGKILPQCIDIEQAVLGACLTYVEAFLKLSKVLKPEHFYKSEHVHIWQAMMDLYNKDQPIDILTLSDKLKRDKKVEEAGGFFYIASLTNNTTTNTRYHYYAYIILQKFILREIIRISDENIKRAYDDDDPFELITDFRMQLDELDNNNTSLAVANAKDAVESTMNSMHAAISGKIITVYETGHAQFDELVGFARNEILLIAGPAGHGKTKFTTSMIFRLLERHKDVAVDWYSFEDPKEKLIRCQLASLTGFDDKLMTGKYKRKKLTTDDLLVLAQFSAQISSYDIDFHDDRMSIRDVKYSFNRFCEKRPNKFNICIIDNLLLLTDTGRFTERDDHIMGTISTMKTQSGIIIPIHHFSDEQQSADRAKNAYRPRAKDMKGSEGYRRVPTQILLINKPGAYSDIAKLYSDRPEMPFLFITDLAKNRDGATSVENNGGIIRWYADLELNIFHEY